MPHQGNPYLARRNVLPGRAGVAGMPLRGNAGAHGSRGVLACGTWLRLTERAFAGFEWMEERRAVASHHYPVQIRLRRQSLDSASLTGAMVHSPPKSRGWECHARCRKVRHHDAGLPRRKWTLCGRCRGRGACSLQLSGCRRVENVARSSSSRAGGVGRECEVAGDAHGHVSNAARLSLFHHRSDHGEGPAPCPSRGGPSQTGILL